MGDFTENDPPTLKIASLPTQKDLTSPHTSPQSGNMRKTVHETPTFSLAEDTTSSLEWETPVTMLQLETLLLEFCSDTSIGDFLSRGMPYVESLSWDSELEMPHIYLSLQVPFKNPSEATEEGVRQELQEFTKLLRPLFRERQFAVSAVLS